MNLYSLDSALLALLVLGLVVPTGAVMTGAGDQVWGERGVVLSPNSGPNGAYAEIGSSGNLSIDLATVGVNANALTSIREVFDVANHGEAPLHVWITHDANESVLFSTGGGSGVGSGESIEGPENRLELGPGQARPVSLQIDTAGRESSPEPLLSEFEVHVAPVPQEPPPSTSTPTEPPGENGGGRPDAGRNETTTPPSTGTDPDVQVVFDDAADEPVTVRDVGVGEIEQLGDEDDTREPRATIEHAHGDRPVIGNECPCADDARLQALGADALVEVDQEITLSATGSLVGSMRSVDRERRLLRAVDIDVPAGRHDSPATVRMRVDEARFEATDLSRPRMARKTDGGWQMLQTKVVGRENGELILEARTPGFSVFAVFATNDVQYVWRVDGETVPADEIRHEWETPGLHDVSLTVRDAFGRTDTATYRVLVNDPPSVAIEAPANLTAGDSTTLRANVTNEVGNATVTWLFPDGSRATGTEVERAFRAGERTVRVEVEDEFGATGATERTLVVAPAGGQEPLVDRITGESLTVVRLGAIALLSVLLVLLLRRLVGGRIPQRARWVDWLATRLAGPFRNRAPRIVAVDSPSVDVRNRRFSIGHIRVEDPDGNLETVELRVLDGRGMEVARKSLDLRGRPTYVSHRETLLPKSRAYVRADDEYTVEVSARDAGDRWSRHRQGRIRAAGAADG